MINHSLLDIYPPREQTECSLDFFWQNKPDRFLFALIVGVSYNNTEDFCQILQILFCSCLMASINH